MGLSTGLDVLGALATALDLEAPASFALGMFFFGMSLVGFGPPFVTVCLSAAGFEAGSVSVTSVILDVFLSDKVWNRVALMLGRGFGLWVELAGRALGLGGSLGALGAFHAGVTLGAPSDLVYVTLKKSSPSQNKSILALPIGKYLGHVLRCGRKKTR